MRLSLILFLILMLTPPVAAQDFPAEAEIETEALETEQPPMPDFDAMRQDLRDDYLRLKQEVEEDYTVRINAIDPGPTQLQLQIEKQSLEAEFRERKQEILDDYQHRMIELRDEEAALKGELDRYYYEEKPDEPKEFKLPVVKKPVPEKEEEVQRRGSRTIPPFSGKSELGTKPQYKSRGRAGGLVKSKRRAEQLREARERDERGEDDAKKKPDRRSVNDARSMFDKRRR